MNIQEIQAKFNILPTDEQKRIEQLANEIKWFGQNIFWLETGNHADEPGNWWQVVGFIMRGIW